MPKRSSMNKMSRSGKLMLVVLAAAGPMTCALPVGQAPKPNVTMEVTTAAKELLSPREHVCSCACCSGDDCVPEYQGECTSSPFLPCSEVEDITGANDHACAGGLGVLNMSVNEDTSVCMDLQCGEQCDYAACARPSSVVLIAHAMRAGHQFVAPLNTFVPTTYYNLSVRVACSLNQWNNSNISLQSDNFIDPAQSTPVSSAIGAGFRAQACGNSSTPVPLTSQLIPVAAPTFSFA